MSLHVIVVLYLCVGMLVATHAHWHQAYRSKKYTIFLVQTVISLLFWWLLVGIRATVMLRSRRPSAVHVIDMPQHVFDDIIKQGINVFCLEQSKNPVPGDRLVIRCIAATPSSSMQFFTIESRVCVGSGTGIQYDHVMVVCNKEHVF